MTIKRHLANLTLLPLLLGAVPAYAQTAIDTFAAESYLDLTGALDTTAQSARSREYVDSDLGFNVCRLTGLSQSSTGPTRQPFFSLHVIGGSASLYLRDLTNTAIRTYGASALYGRCTTLSSEVTAMGVAVPASFSLDVDGAPAANAPTFIITAYTSDSGTNVIHTLAQTTTSTTLHTLTFTGTSFSPALPTSGTAVLNNVSIKVSGSSSLTDEEDFSWSNFVMN